MKTHTLRVKDGKAHHAIDTDCAEFKDRFLIYIYVDERGDPTAVRLLDSWQGASPCPTTPSGADADTGANGAGSSTGSRHVDRTTNAPSSGSSTDTAPPQTVEPDPMKWVRMTRSAVERTRDNGLNPNWWCHAAIRLCDAHEALLDRLARIAAILSDDALEHPQAIGRALRVAEGMA